MRKKKKNKLDELNVRLGYVCIVTYILLIASMVGLYFFGWSLFNEAKECYTSMLGNPASADSLPWVLIWTYSFFGYAPFIFALAHQILWGDEMRFSWILSLASFGWLIYFFVFMAKTFPMIFTLWGGALCGAFWGLLIGVVLCIIFNVIIQGVGAIILGKEYMPCG